MSIGKTSVLEKAVIAEEALEANSIVKFGTDDNKVKKAVSATADALIGVTESKAEAGKMVNVMLVGVAEVKLHLAADRGDLITSHDNGRGKPTTTAKNWVVGIATASGVAGDVIPVLLAQSAL